MKKALLLYNPRSGAGARRRRRQKVDVVLRVLRQAGVEVEARETVAGSTAAQASVAVASGCDTVIACGGDGTIHDVLQGIAGTTAVLGVIPMGTANSLANDLRLPRLPAQAAAALLKAQPRRIAVGLIACRDQQGAPIERYFIVAAGIGLDACVFQGLNANFKRRLGLISYYLRGFRLWMTHPMHEFSAQLAEGEAQFSVTQLLAVRIRNFGGLLRELAPGACLTTPDLRMVAFRTRSRAQYMNYALRNLIGARWPVPAIEVSSAQSARCEPAGGETTYVEADGEFLGVLPAEIRLVPDALTILVP